MAAVSEKNYLAKANVQVMCRVCKKRQDQVEKIHACANCLTSYYCSKEHQTTDWPEHKTFCIKYQCADEVKSKLLVEKREACIAAIQKSNGVAQFLLKNREKMKKDEIGGFLFVHAETNQSCFFSLPENDASDASKIFLNSCLGNPPQKKYKELVYEVVRQDPAQALVVFIHNKKDHHVFVLTFKEYVQAYKQSYDLSEKEFKQIYLPNESKTPTIEEAFEKTIPHLPDHLLPVILKDLQDKMKNAP